MGRGQQGNGIVLVPLMDEHLHGLPDYQACTRYNAASDAHFLLPNTFIPSSIPDLVPPFPGHAGASSLGCRA